MRRGTVVIDYGRVSVVIEYWVTVFIEFGNGRGKWHRWSTNMLR